MPKKLEDCVQDLMDKGESKDSAYAICAKSTGWVRKKGGGWRNKKTGETFNESFSSFYDLFVESDKSDNPFKGIKKGALHKWCGIPEDEDITCECIKKAKAAGGHPAKMAQWALNFSDIDCKDA
jgi:hypothetical protein